MSDIKYDRKGRMLYNPEFHPNHRKPFTKDDLIYLCKFYEFVGSREMSFALGKTETTVANKFADLRNSGRYKYYRSLIDEQWERITESESNLREKDAG